VSQLSRLIPGLRGRGPDLAWSAALVVASVVGGLAAADITQEPTGWAVLISLVVAAVAVFALFQGWLGEIRPAYGPPAGQGQPAGPPAGQRGPGGPGHPGAPRAFPGSPESVLDEERTEQYESVQPTLVRVVQQPGSGAWWEGQPPRPAGPAARPVSRRVELAQFLGQAVIAQCPNCGSFHVDFRNEAEPWVFWCGECRQQWPWQPGTPWPAIAVRPNARGRMHPPRA
jgi:hypothetical protein